MSTYLSLQLVLKHLLDQILYKTECFTVSTIYNNIIVHMEKEGKYYKGKSDDLVSRNSHDVLVISLWILLFIKHMQHYKMTIIM